MFKKGIFLTIGFLLLIIQSLSAYNIKIDDQNFNMSILDMKVSKGKTVLLCIDPNNNGKFKPMSLFAYENGTWNQLPATFQNDHGAQNLNYWRNYDLSLDSSDNIWVSGFSLYKYSNNKWEEFYIDDSLRMSREYQQICTDKYNNIWVCTSVYDTQKEIYQSDIYKFADGNFTKIIEIDHESAFEPYNLPGSSMAALPDGRIIVERVFNSLLDMDIDFTSDEDKEIYIFRQDGTYNQYKLQSPSGIKYEHWLKRINNIYPETENKIWFSLDKFVLQGTSFCCSGLSQINNGQWKIFDESNGFEKQFSKPDSLMEVLLSIQKMPNGNYLAVGLGKLWTSKNGENFTKVDWDKVFENCTFIPTYNSLANEEYFQQYVDDIKAGRNGFTNVILQDNGELWLEDGRGIVITNQKVLSVSNETIKEDNFSVYPNPATNTLNIDMPIGDYKFNIYNLFGEAVIKNQILNSKIDVSNFVSGYYLIQIFSHDELIKSISFIKQ